VQHAGKTGDDLLTGGAMARRLGASMLVIALAVTALTVGLPEPTSAAAPAVAELQVLSLEYYPLTADGQNIDITVTGDVGEPAQVIRDRVAGINTNLVAMLSDGTRFRGHTRATAQPSLTFRIVDTIRRDVAVPTVPYEITGTPYAVRPDYMGIMNGIDICSRVAAGLDEVWMWAYQGPTQLAISESNMAGPHGDISNSYRLNDLPVCAESYVVYTFNYQRGTSEAVESYGHQLESEFRHFGSVLYHLWIGPSHPLAEGKAGRCGSVHNPPNAAFEYDRGNPTPNASDCLDWDPDGLGSTTMIDCSVWGCAYNGDDDNPPLNYQIWWRQNVPGHENGITHGGAPLRNWWSAHANFDQFMANGWTLSKPSPSLPTNVETHDPGTGSMGIRWGDVVGETAYRVCWGLEKTDLSTCVDRASDSTSYRVFGLESATQYWFEVCASYGTEQACAEPVSGTTAVPSPSPPTTKVVDDKTAGFRKFQLGWKRQQAGYEQRSFWTPVRKGSVKRRATWTATLDAPGTYRVLVKFPRRNATTRAAKYKVHAADGIKTRKVSQRYKAGLWASLGTHEFDSVAKVKLTDKTGEPTRSGRRIVFDVVKFVPVDVSASVDEIVVAPEVIGEPEPTPGEGSEPTPRSSASPTPDTHELTPAPSAAPTSEPVPQPTPEPSPSAMPEPTPEPKEQATPDPTVRPEDKATPDPTAEPTPENQDPVADAGGPYKVDEGDTVKLDARGSKDTDGEIVAYEWTRNARLDDATKKRPLFSAVDDGKLDIELAVTDDAGASDTDVATIKVRNVDPVVAEFGPFVVTVGEELILDVVIHDPGQKDTHEGVVDWGDSTMDAPAQFDEGSATAKHVYTEPGDHELTVSVTDDDGGSGSRATAVSVTVDPVGDGAVAGQVEGAETD